MPGKKNKSYRSKKKNKCKNKSKNQQGALEQRLESEAQQPGEQEHEAVLALAHEYSNEFLARTLADRSGKPSIQTHSLDSLKWIIQVTGQLDEEDVKTLESRIDGIKCTSCKRLAARACGSPGCMAYSCDSECSDSKSTTVQNCMVCGTCFCDGCAFISSCVNCDYPVCDSCNTASNGYNIKSCNQCGEKHCTLGGSDCSECDHTDSNYIADNKQAMDKCVIC
jgi:hypothetical protein